MGLQNLGRAWFAAGVTLSCLLAGSARAGVVLSWSLNEGYFDAVVSGSLSSGELAQAGFIFSQSETASAFMDTQPYFASFPAGTHQRVLFLAADVAFTPNFIRLNSYSGNTRSGDVFGFFKTSFNDLMMILPSGYQANTPLNATFRSSAYGNSLDNAFTFGDVVTVKGAPLITFAAVAPVPEPATSAMALAGLACGGFSMWRRKRRLHGRSLAIAASLASVVAVLAGGPAPAAPITLDMVTVGDPGNASDPTTGHGTVDYEYRIGRHMVTIDQYAAFLNAVDPDGVNTYGLFNGSMQSNLNVAGISFDSERVAGFKYEVMTNDGYSGSRPITCVSWFDAARFANWMQNGQGSGDTETGAYTLDGATSGVAPGRNPGAQFYIPTQNEWYKAAYYSPVKEGVGSPGYYYYPTQSDSDPGNTIGDGSNQANSYFNDLYAVTQSADYDSAQNYLTDVGAFTNSASYYGTFDQGGVAYEWNDLDGTASLDRQIRGGSWANYTFYMASDHRVVYSVSAENDLVGFRLASPVAVPEPSTWCMALAGLVCGGWATRRRRRGGECFLTERPLQPERGDFAVPSSRCSTKVECA